MEKMKKSRRGLYITVGVILFIYAKVKNLSFARILDMYAPAIAIGHTFGRVGCFLQGCCFGKPCSWGVVYPGNSAPAERFPDYLSPVKNMMEGIPSLPLAPVQLIEAAGNIVLCVFLLKLFKYVKRPVRSPQHTLPYMGSCVFFWNFSGEIIRTVF